MREEFQIEATAPVLLGQFEKISTYIVTGVVDQNVEPAKFARHRVDQFCRFFRYRQVAGIDGSLSAKRTDLIGDALQCLGVARSQHHIAASCCEFERDAASDTPARPGNQSDFHESCTVRMLTSDVSVRCTGHLSAISISRA